MSNKIRTCQMRIIINPVNHPLSIIELKTSKRSVVNNSPIGHSRIRIHHPANQCFDSKSMRKDPKILRFAIIELLNCILKPTEHSVFNLLLRFSIGCFKVIGKECISSRYRAELNDIRMLFKLGGLKNDPF